MSASASKPRLNLREAQSSRDSNALVDAIARHTTQEYERKAYPYWTSSPLVACRVPCRAATWAISCAMTPAIFSFVIGIQKHACIDEKNPPGSANALISSSSITL